MARCKQLVQDKRHKYGMMYDRRQWTMMEPRRSVSGVSSKQTIKAAKQSRQDHSLPSPCKSLSMTTISTTRRRRSLTFLLLMGYIQLSQGFTASSIAKKNRPCLVHSISHSPRQTVIHLQATVPSSDDAGSGGPIMDKASSLSPNPFFETVKLVGASFLVALLVISWEDVSMSHPMRTYMASSQPQQIGASTVRGLAFSQRDRQLLEEDMEPQALKEIPSFSEVSLKHRMERVPTWDETRPMTRQDVELAVQTIQKALVYLGECKTLATNYEWDDLTTHIRGPLLHSEMEQASALLKRANGFLSTQARDEIGFDWGSCAWRHCGALADAQESIDELDSLIGVLEPYECLFVLDIVERSFRDMLAVTTSYQDPSISIPEYQPIQRMSESAEDDGMDGTETDYLVVLSELRSK